MKKLPGLFVALTHLLFAACTSIENESVTFEEDVPAELEDQASAEFRRVPPMPFGDEADQSAEQTIRISAGKAVFLSLPVFRAAQVSFDFRNSSNAPMSFRVKRLASDGSTLEVERATSSGTRLDLQLSPGDYVLQLWAVDRRAAEVVASAVCRNVQQSPEETSAAHAPCGSSELVQSATFDAAEGSVGLRIYANGEIRSQVEEPEHEVLAHGFRLDAELDLLLKAALAKVNTTRRQTRQRPVDEDMPGLFRSVRAYSYPTSGSFRVTQLMNHSELDNKVVTVSLRGSQDLIRFYTVLVMELSDQDWEDSLRGFELRADDYREQDTLVKFFESSLPWL